jgi:hypothetical protein
MNNTVPNKVVSLSDYDRAKRPEGSGLLVECRDMAADLLSKSLTKMLDRVDESLFELAENALSTEVRMLYLDARSKALAHRASIESEFRKNFVSGFNRSLTSADAGISYGRSSGLSLELSLVDEDDLEASIAATDIAKKMKAKTGDELSALDCRIGELLHNPDLKEEDNPLGPQSIINAFKDACNQLESNVNIKLIILKQFDSLVTDDISSVYQSLNKHLVNRNVLPTIPPELLRRRGANAPASTRAQSEPKEETAEAPSPAPDVSVNAEAELFTTLQQLMSQNQREAPRAGGFAAATGGAFPELNVGVMDMLTNLQRGDTAALEVEGSSFDPEVLSSGQVNVLHQLRQSHVGQAANQMDAMTIDIVAMLFDYIFDDRHIPDSLKALIGRLQIPVLKVAMLDKKFFSKKSHPARRLLDTLAHAALGWAAHADEHDRLQAKVEELVHRILTSFEEDFSVFEEAQLQLDAFLKEEERLAQERAENSAQVIYDREWLEVAQSVAEDEIRRRLESNEMPLVIREFISAHWSNFLLSTYVKNGADSDAWQAALQTMDDLIWSVAPKKAAEERMRLVNMLPGMLKRLEHALESNATAKDVRERFFSELVHCHATAIKSGNLPPKPVDTIVPEKVEVRFDISTHTASEIEQRLLGELVPVETLAEEKPASATNFELDLIASVNQRKPDEKVAEIQSLLAEKKLATQDGDIFDQNAAGLQRGSWVEFLMENGQSIKAKLAWISPLKNMYLFTNRQGLNAMSIKLSGLAAKFRNHSARIVEDEALVDRAVSNMLDNLKNTIRR